MSAIEGTVDYVYISLTIVPYDGYWELDTDIAAILAKSYSLSNTTFKTNP